MTRLLTRLATLILAVGALATGALAQRTGDIELRVRFPDTLNEPIVQGQLRNVQLRLRNTTDRVLIVREVRFADQLPDTNLWIAVSPTLPDYSISEGGEILSQPSTMNKQIHTAGIIPPGWTIVVTRPLRLVRERQPVEIELHSLTTAQARENLILLSGNPRFIRAPEQWEAQQSIGRGRVGVLLDPAAGRIRTQRARVQFELPAAEFTPQQAMERAEMAGAAFTRWTGGHGWVLRQGDRTVLVTPSEVRPLPAGDLTVYDALDRDAAASRDGRVRVVLSSPEVAEAAPAGARPDRDGAVALTGAELRSLMDRCREAGVPLLVRVVRQGRRSASVVTAGELPSGAE